MTNLFGIAKLDCIGYYFLHWLIFSSIEYYYLLLLIIGTCAKINEHIDNQDVYNFYNKLFWEI